MGTIDDYLETLDPPDAVIIAHTYEVARGVVPDAEQGLGYGMPALVYRGKPLLSIMRAKAHVGLYPFSPDAVAAVADRLDGFDLAKGTIRMPVDRPIPDDALRALLLIED